MSRPIGNRTSLKTQHMNREGSSVDFHQYAANNSLRVHPVLQKLADKTMEHPCSIMLGSLDELQLFQNLCRSIGAKKTLDIGVFTGASALAVALALPEDGKVVACDVSEDYVSVGRPYWKEAGVDNKINFVCAPAAETLDKLIANGEAGTYDFAFIDADKPNYQNYYEKCVQLIRSGGIIALDNTLWSGSVLDESRTDDSTVALRNISKVVHKDERVYPSFLVMGDGVMLAFKK